MKINLILTVLMVLLIMPSPTSGSMFPPQLQNPPSRGSRVDSIRAESGPAGVKVSPVSFSLGDREIDGVVLRPEEDTGELLPGVLFLWPPDEVNPDGNEIMGDLAGKGYVVLSTRWEDSSGAEASYDYLESIPGVDETSIAIMGVHQGGTEAILLGCSRRTRVKAVISVSAHPPYDMPGGDPAGSIWAPVLLIHGEVDRQVPPSVARYFYHNLLEKERITEIYILPFSSHRLNLTEWSQAMIEVDLFIKKYVLSVPEDKKYDPMDYRRDRKTR